MINLLFSMDGPKLTAEEAQPFAPFGEWVVLHERDGRLLVDAIGDAMQALAAAGRNPTPIGGWKRDGTPVAGYALDEAAWLAVAPDDWDMTDPDNPVPVRPTEWRDIHRWAGWGEKQ